MTLDNNQEIPKILKISAPVRPLLVVHYCAYKGRIKSVTTFKEIQKANS